MKKITPQPYYVYSFDELTEKAKENAIKNFNYDWLYDQSLDNFEYLKEWITEKITAAGYSNVDIYSYEYGYRRFSFCLKAGITEKTLKEKTGINPFDDDFYPDSIVDIDFDTSYLKDYFINDKTADFIEKELSDFANEFKKAASDDEDYLYSDENIIDFYINNDFEFYENGTIH